MRARRRAFAFGALALGAGIALAATALSIATGRTSRQGAVYSRSSRLTTSRGAVGGGLSLDGTSLRKSQRTVATLGEGDEVIAPLTGSLIPVAAAGSNGDFVVYSSWKQLGRVKPDARGQGLSTGQPVGLPSVRLFDLRTGRDRLVANGAAAPALAPTGALAYLVGETEVVRQNVEYTGRVVVADSPDAKPRVWTSRPARYLPYAWAGNALLVYRGIPDSEAADLYAYTGPDESHLLAPEAFVIAVSPDGEKVLAAVAMRTLEVISIADASVEDSLSLNAVGSGSGSARLPHVVLYNGSWRGDRVVANSDRGLVVLNMRGGLHVEATFGTPALPHGISEPVFVDDTHVEGWADLPDPHASPQDVDEPSYDNALVSCDLALGSCAVGASNRAREWAHRITNPS
jgi:hypothetical protein